jgi:hypothetical protein
MIQKFNALLAGLGNTLKSFYAKASQDVKDIWAQDKVFFIAFGAIILTIKFRDILISLLVSSGKRVFTKAQTQDADLAKQETQANQQSDQLVQDAQNAPSKEKPITDDWNKK